MKKRYIGLIFVNLLLVVACWIIVLYYYPMLPEKVPTHYGFHGPPDAWGSKSTMLILPILQTGVVLSCLILSLLVESYPQIYRFPVDPKILSQEGKEELYSLTRVFLLNTGIWINLLFIYTAVTTINVALGKWEVINGYIMAFLLCSVFGVLIYYFIKMRGIKSEKY